MYLPLMSGPAHGPHVEIERLDFINGLYKGGAFSAQSRMCRPSCYRGGSTGSWSSDTVTEPNVLRQLFNSESGINLGRFCEERKCFIFRIPFIKLKQFWSRQFIT